ncbi:MAG: hypothetical protein ACKO23_07565, partial [Gemmataceae bacterium]
QVKSDRLFGRRKCGKDYPRLLGFVRSLGFEGLKAFLSRREMIITGNSWGPSRSKQVSEWQREQGLLLPEEKEGPDFIT